MLFSSLPTLHLFLELYRSHSSVFNAFLVDGQKMPLGLSSYYFFARSLVRSLAFCLSPSISSCYKKDNFFYIFVAFPCCLSQTPVFFFYPLKVKRERIKNKHTPERTRGERGVWTRVWTASLCVCVCVYVGNFGMKMAPIPCFFCECVFFSFFGVTNGFFPLPASSTLSNLHQKKTSAPESSILKKKKTREYENKKKKKKNYSVMSVLIGESEFPGPVLLLIFLQSIY